MKAEQKNVWTLFSSKQQFKIPLYQRHYDWKEEQCEALWEDFVRLCEKNEMNHYLGTMVVEEYDGMFQIVDGQQRTTSLMLLFKALQDYVGEDQCADLRPLTHIPSSCLSAPDIGGVPVERSTSKSMLRLIPQGEGTGEADFQSFSALMEDGVKAAHRDPSNENFRRNLEYFRSSIHAYAQNSSETKGLTCDRIKSSLGRMWLAFVELDRKGQDKDDPQTIFEKMNAEGKDLEVHDLIRNYIFMLAAESTETHTSSRSQSAIAGAKQQSLYLNEWQNLEHEFPDRAFDQMKHFFRDYLIIKTGDVAISSGRELYVKFKKHLRDTGDNVSIGEFKNVEKLANEIWRYADAWGKVVFGSPIKETSVNSKNLQKQLKEFSAIAHAPYYPFATILMVHWQEQHANLVKIIQTLNKFIAISAITETTVAFTRDFLASLVDPANKLNDLKAFVENPSVFQEKLKGLWPKGFDPSRELEKALLGRIQFGADAPVESQDAALEFGSPSQTKEDEPQEEGTDECPKQDLPDSPSTTAILAPPDVYHGNRRITTYLLLKINEQMMGETGDTLLDYLQPNHSLEHIMSQKCAEDWRFVDSAFYDTHLNSLGNLTLVGKEFNTAILNRPLARKIEYYKRSSYIITRELAVQLRGVMTPGPEAKPDMEKIKKCIDSRARELTQRASNIFQF